MRATVLLCDWAHVPDGKVYAQGAGWAAIRANQPVSFSIAVLIHVPYVDTNTKHQLSVALVTEDGESFPSEEPLRIEAGFEVGRPPGMRKGEESNVPFAAKVEGLTFQPGGYVFRVEIDGNEVAYAPFTAKENLP